MESSLNNPLRNAQLENAQQVSQNVNYREMENSRPPVVSSSQNDPETLRYEPQYIYGQRPSNIQNDQETSFNENKYTYDNVQTFQQKVGISLKHQM